MRLELATLAEAQTLLQTEHPNAVLLIAVTELLGSCTVHLDRDAGTVLLVHDWSDDDEAPVVSVREIDAREILVRGDFAEWIESGFDDHEDEPHLIRAVLEELAAAVAAGSKSRVLPQPIATLQQQQALLESQLSLVKAVRARQTRQAWEERQAESDDPAAIAEDMFCVSTEELAELIAADRRLLRDW